VGVRFSEAITKWRWAQPKRARLRAQAFRAQNLSVCTFECSNENTSALHTAKRKLAQSYVSQTKTKTRRRAIRKLAVAPKGLFLRFFQPENIRGTVAEREPLWLPVIQNLAQSDLNGETAIDQKSAKIPAELVFSSRSSLRARGARERPRFAMAAPLSEQVWIIDPRLSSVTQKVRAREILGSGWETGGVLATVKRYSQRGVQETQTNGEEAWVEPGLSPKGCY